jgi:hypothetical protein
MLLCSSCNAAKGEKPFEQFFSIIQLEALIGIHRILCQRMMADLKLRQIASKWYERSVQQLNGVADIPTPDVSLGKGAFCTD